MCKVRQKLISGMQSVCSALGFLQGERSYFQLRAAWLHIAVKCVPRERHFWHLPAVSGWLLDSSFTSFPPRSSLILPRFALSRCVYPSPSTLLHSPATTLSGCSPETNTSSKTAPVEVITGNPAIIICACRGLTDELNLESNIFYSVKSVKESLTVFRLDLTLLVSTPCFIFYTLHYIWPIYIFFWLKYILIYAIYILKSVKLN